MAAADTPHTPYLDSTAGHVPLPRLRQYAAGTLPAEEQHRVEAHTLACSRCADILDGLMLSDAAVTDQAVAQLRRRLQARIGQAETTVVAARPSIWPWRQVAAAAVLLITLGSAAFFWLSSVQNQPEIPVVAATTQEQITTSVPVPESVEPPLASIRMAPSARASASLLQPPPQKRHKAATRQRAGDTVVAARGREEKTADTLAVAAVPTPAQAASIASVPVAPSATVDQSGVEATRLVRGRITNADGQALPGAVVQASGTAASTVTAADGSFALQVPTPARQLTISSIGYQTHQQLLHQDTTHFTLALLPAAHQLQEVAMVRREKAPTPAAVEALPAGGYSAFRQYLKDSLDYPIKALDERKEGTVQLRFTVAADGSLQDISVTRKVSAEIDAEAVRLLREGPKWFPAIRNGQRVAHPVTLSVPFRLEDYR